MADSSHKEHPKHAWTVAAAASDWNNDSGTGYDDSFEKEKGLPPRTSVDRETSGFSVSNMSMTQVLEEHDETHAKITSFQAFLVLFKSCIGVAILGMPFAFRQSGIITGVLFLVLNAIVTTFTTKLLVSCKRKLQESPRGKNISSVPDMALVLWGPLGLNITNIILVFCQIGNCVAYGIFLSVTSTAVVQELAIFPEHTFGIRSYDSPYFFMTIMWGIVFSRLVQIEHMSKLAPFLFIAQIAMFTALFMVIGYGLTHRTVCDADGVIAYFCKVHYELRESSFPIFLGIAVFALEGMPTVLLIESSMENPDDFDTVFARSMSAVVTLMVIFGTMGYWLFGAHTKSVISLNTQGMVGSVVKMLLCMVICLSYPLQFMPLTQIFDMVAESSLVSRVHLAYCPKMQREELLSRLKFWMKMFGVTVGCIVTVLFPHFGHILSILGSVLFSWVVYLSPCLMYFTAYTSSDGSRTRSKVVLCSATIVFGFGIMALGLWSNFVHVEKKGVYHHHFEIEKAPPKVGSRKVKQAQHIFKEAAGLGKKGQSHLMKSEVKRGVDLPPALIKGNGNGKEKGALDTEHLGSHFPFGDAASGKPPHFQTTQVVSAGESGANKGEGEGGAAGKPEGAKAAGGESHMSDFAGARIQKKAKKPIPVEVARFPPDLPQHGEKYEPKDGPHKPGHVPHVPAFWQGTKPKAADKGAASDDSKTPVAADSPSKPQDSPRAKGDSGSVSNLHPSPLHPADSEGDSGSVSNLHPSPLHPAASVITQNTGATAAISPLKGVLKGVLHPKVAAAVHSGHPEHAQASPHAGEGENAEKEGN